MAQFVNTALASGQYQGFAINDSSAVTVELTSITVEKAAERRIWNNADIGFTITARNIEDPETGVTIEDVTITDTIPANIGIIDEDTLALSINGEPVDPVPYTYENGVLIVTVGNLAPGAVAIVNFRCDKPTE